MKKTDFQAVCESIKPGDVVTIHRLPIMLRRCFIKYEPFDIVVDRLDPEYITGHETTIAPGYIEPAKRCAYYAKIKSVYLHKHNQQNGKDAEQV